MTRLLLTSLFLLLGLVACELPPRFVQESSEIDAFLARRAYRSACVGLDMRDDDKLREYTAGRLAEYGHVNAVNDCLCAALYDAEAHTFDPMVAKGLAGTHRDDLAACLSPALDDAAITGKDRVGLVRSLAGLDARGAYGSLQALLADDPDPAVRALAADALRPSDDAMGVLLEALTSDEAPSVRAAAARALTDRRDDKVVEAIVRAAKEDDDGEVRGAALGAVVKTKVPEVDEMVCTAMMEDPDERVRVAAIEAWHGTKRIKALECLEKRARTFDESGTVRTKLLAALGASPSDEAAKILCRNIGAWLRLYVKDKIYNEIEGSDIVEAQNNRDWERSYDCVHAALREGGYSCYARNYLGHWSKKLGGNASTPWCPGMVRN